MNFIVNKFFINNETWQNILKDNLTIISLTLTILLIYCIILSLYRNEALIMACENEYILFLDETDTNDVNEFFCLAGFIISRQEYEDVLIPKINKLKLDVLNSPHIVFHYKDMRQNAGEYTLLRNGELRKTFWIELCAILKKLNIVTVGAYINAVEYRKHYSKIGLSEYNVLFNEVINSFIHFLVANNGTGTIMLESREPSQNKSTQSLFAGMTQHGTNVYLASTIRSKISTLNFNIKKDNSIGLQVADMIPLVFIRQIHKRENPYTLYNTLSSKLYKGGQKVTSGYGLMKILR